MHEYNNNFAFPLHFSIYTAIFNIQCFFFPLVYFNGKKIFLAPLSNFKAASHMNDFRTNRENSTFKKETIVSLPYPH